MNCSQDSRRKWISQGRIDCFCFHEIFRLQLTVSSGHSLLIQGFTLIEVLVVVAIVAILAAFAYPAFVGSMQKGRRSDAMSSLLVLQQNQERWRATNASYTPTLDNVWTGGGATDSLDGHYTLSITAASAADFTAVSAPKAGGPQVGVDCGSFAVDRNGPDYSGGYADRACWKR